MDALMNVIEESKEQVPDMVYKNLIESFAKARIEKKKESRLHGWWVKITALKTSIRIFNMGKCECACGSRDSDSDSDSDSDDGMHSCKRCQYPHISKEKVQVGVYIPSHFEDFRWWCKYNHHFDNETQIPDDVDWLDENFRKFLNEKASSLCGFTLCTSHCHYKKNPDYSKIKFYAENEKWTNFLRGGKIKKLHIKYNKFIMIKVDCINKVCHCK